MNIPSQQLIDEVQDLINGGKLEVADTLGISILIDFAKEARKSIVLEGAGTMQLMLDANGKEIELHIKPA